MTRQQLKNHLIFIGVSALSRLMQALPLAWARGLARALARVFFAVVPFERNKALRSVAIAFPDLDPVARRALARGAFVHLGVGGIEFMRFPLLDRAGLDGMVARTEGWEAFEALCRQGRGVVAVTGHLGSWELMAAWVAARWPKTGVIAQKLYDPRFDEVLNQVRRDKGLQIFPRNTPVRPILKFLKDGGLLGVLADQDTNVDSLWVPFFGRPAKTPSGAAWLAQATGAALATVWTWREADGRYAIRFEAEIPVPPRGSDLTPVVAEYARRTEMAIRQHPEQWVWMHDRWRSKPPVAEKAGA